MAGIKVRRTLDDRGFKKYMAFCESLKDGSNDALIDTFKYRFAVMEGRIVPKKRTKPLTEARGLGMGDFEKAFQGLVGAFLPHLDKEEQDILGCVCSVLDEKVNGGDIEGAMDALKGAVKDAGGDPDAYEDEDFDEDDVCPECGKCGDECECGDDGCPEGECKVDGECVPCKDAPEAKEECGEKPSAKEECGEKPVTECGDGEALEEGVTDLMDDPENDFRDGMYPAEDDYPSELDFDRSAASPETIFGGEAREPVADYDAMADELLRDAGYGDLTVENSGVRPENRRFLGR